MWRGRWSKQNFVNKNKVCNKWSILYSNVRDYMSKALSVNSIASCINSNLILLGDTFLKKDSVSTCGSEEDAKFTLKTKEGI